MPQLTAQPLNSINRRRYSIQVPDNPPQALVPAIVVFHGHGQDPATIAARWGITVGAPPPADLANYLLVFPESDPGLDGGWVFAEGGAPSVPSHDLQFVQQLFDELTTTPYATASAAVPTVSADPELLYVAGFSSGALMTWQLLNSPVSAAIQGFAAVGAPMVPDMARLYRQFLGAGVDPAPAPVAYVQGTADTTFRPTLTQREMDLDITLPYFTVTEMLRRNEVAPGAATASFVAGSGNVTEVVEQLFQGLQGDAFLQVTVINGGHNWPTPTTVGNPPVASHYNATAAIVEFWRTFAGLPG